MSIRSSSSCREGFTLLETLIATALTLVIFGLIAGFVITSNRMVADETTHAMLEDRALHVIEMLVDDARRSSASQLVPAAPGGATTEISFLPVVALDDDGSPQFSAAAVRYQVEPAPGEIPGNGRDDDDNGLVDDQQLRRTTAEQAAAGDPGTVVLTGLKGWDDKEDASRSGFLVRRIPDTRRLRFELVVQGRDSAHRLLEKVCRSAVTLRNP